MMARPLHRGFSGGGRVAETSRVGDSWGSPKKEDSWDSQMKDKIEKEGFDKPRPLPYVVSFWTKLIGFDASSDHIFLKQGPRLSSKSLAENGFGSDPKDLSSQIHSRIDLDSPSARRIRQGMVAMRLLQWALALIVLISVSGFLWWTISISSSRSGTVYRGYRRLQEQVIVDLVDIGVLSSGVSNKLKELDFCSHDLENFVPCFNVSENLALGHSNEDEYDRQCVHKSREKCLVLPPKDYRIPLRWPTGRDVIWSMNVKITPEQVVSSGSLTKRMMLLEDNQISFRSDSLMVDGVEDYSHQIAEMIGLRNESNFIHAGVRTVLDIGCGYGSFGAHLFSKQLLTMCIAIYEVYGSQVQLALERGLPAMIASFNSKQLPYSSLSFDMLHCARCGIEWEQKDGAFLIEADRVLRPGGYFVWTSPLTNLQGSSRNKSNQKKWEFVRDFALNLCWEMLSQQDETVVWKKTSRRNCYASREFGAGPSLCFKGQDIESPYYRPLQTCIAGTHSRRWIPIEERTSWPSRLMLNASEASLHGVHKEDFDEDGYNWQSMVRNYWSLLSPIIFSDHPKRPGDEDPSPPFNMVRNVLDMNALFGGFNAALLDARKSVWVMNVVPKGGPNYLPLILDRGLVGVLHDWCEAFPTYPRTYDLIHAQGIVSFQTASRPWCPILNLFLEMDRILRPEGWVILRDTTLSIEAGRTLAAQMRWDARVVELENNEERLLICQKPFIKKP
ncbi:probable pectin methyltransferase QUA2 [Amborella trichopoda]|nr:probable pectin methyltransferase QUA2 [Amborella trichopoda]XP_020528258.1 probable pectin methyltransferase QUA2 [Amborella trichopoda]|eukprot:XP_006853194.2 probable pectin methyltransferase QUA2 [Amborella trichopoda]